MQFFFDDFVLDTVRRELRFRGERSRMDPLVVDLLACLVERAGEVVDYDALIAKVWEGRSTAPNVISVTMAKLRRALRQHAGSDDYVKNVYGQGYRFVGDVQRGRQGDSVVPRAPASIAPASIAPSDPQPFVGREGVLRSLHAAYAEAAAGRGSLCVLIGEAGLGKTRTLETFERSTSSGLPFLWGRARELEGAPPLWPFLQILRDLLRRFGPDRARVALGQSFEEICDLLPELSPGERSAREPEGRFLVYDAVLRVLTLETASAPIVIVIDDLHGCDVGTFDLLAYLTPELSRLPLLVLATLRSEERPEPPDAQRQLDYVLGHRNCRRLELSRLSQDEVAAYAQRVLEHSSPELAHTVHAKSEGNAFFMVELLRRASETTPGNTHPLTFSDAALDLMRRRVRKLDAEARGLLSTAATIGRSFDLGLLSAVTDQPAARVLEHLDDAFSTDVVRAATDDPDRFVFAHDLMREVLCEDVPQAQLRRLRLRIGEELERRRQSGGTVTDAELAHSFLGALPEGTVERAVHYARRAAQQASAATAYTDAAQLLRRALRALDLMREPPPRLRCDLHYQLALDLRAFDVPGSMAEIDRTAALALQHNYGDVLTLVGALMAPSPGAITLRGARLHLEAALAALDPADSAMRAQALAHLAWTAPNCNSRRDSTRLADEALACARASGSSKALTVALRAKLYLSGGPERSEHDTRAITDELRRLTNQEQHHFRAVTAFDLSAFAMVHALERGDRAAYARALDSLGETAERFRFMEQSWYHTRMRMIGRMAAGEYGGIQAQLDELRESGERASLYVYKVVWAHDFFLFALETGLIEDVDDAWLVRAQPQEIDPPNALALRLRIFVALRRRDTARQILSTFVQRGLRDLPCDRDYLGTLAHLADAAAVFDERAAAHELYELLSPYAAYFATDVSMHTRGSISHWLGVLARTLGKTVDADKHLTFAITQNESMGFAPLAAESRYELARTLAAATDAPTRNRARMLCADALHSARSMGMKPLVRKLEQLHTELDA